MSTTKQVTTQLELVHELTFQAQLKAPVEIGPGPYGNRMYFEVTGGTVEGERIRGTVGTGGGDWLLVDDQGYSHLDVRAQIVTHDEAFIYMTYGGVLEINEAVQGALGGGDGTDWGDQYFRTTPRLETGDERYAWVNRTVFVACGRVANGVEYEVFRVA